MQSTWPMFIHSIKIDADEHMQGQIINLHAQINELKDTLHDTKKSYWNAEAVLTKERRHVKHLEQELKDLKSHSQVEANASVLPPTTMVTAGPTLWVVILFLPQPKAGPSRLPPPQPEAGPSHLPPYWNEMRPSSPPRRLTLGATVPWKWMMNMTGSQRRWGLSWLTAHFLSLRDSNVKDWAPQSTYRASIALKL